MGKPKYCRPGNRDSTQKLLLKSEGLNGRLGETEIITTPEIGTIPEVLRTIRAGRNARHLNATECLERKIYLAVAINLKEKSYIYGIVRSTGGRITT